MWGTKEEQSLGSHRAMHQPPSLSPAERVLLGWAQPGLLCFPGPKPKLWTSLGLLHLPLLRFQGVSPSPKLLRWLDWTGLSQTWWET